MSAAPIFVGAYGVACTLGENREAVAAQLFSDAPPVVSDSAVLASGREVPVGRLRFALESQQRTRTNQLAAHCYQEIAEAVAAWRSTHGAQRLGVVIGTSTSGIGEAGEALKLKYAENRWPEGFALHDQQLGDTAQFVASLAQAEGPCYAISTACTSGGRAISAGARLIRAGLCDAVVCGGVDSVCDLTLNGFAAIESLSDAVCNPFSANRKGINIGEGGAFFLLTREPGAFRIAGWGESADGYHASAPDPEGGGAEIALRRALQMDGLEPSDIGFVHQHGTATRLNDAMEAGLLHRLFGDDTPSSSTKPLTGHTLGAAGAVQAAFCMLSLERGRLPPHIWDGEHDPDLPRIRLAQIGETHHARHMMSASYAFGGNNTALVVSRA